MRTRTAKPAPARSSPYPRRERTKSARFTSVSDSNTPAPPVATASTQTKRSKRKQPPIASIPPPVLRSPLFNGVNPAHLVRALRAIGRGNYADAHGFLYLCIVQARNAAAHRGGASSLVVCLLMLYSDNWLRLGVPSRAVISMEDALIAQEGIGEESEEDRQHATLAGIELRELIESGKPVRANLE
ncbi:hypothetical protein RSOLAG1IB_03419 [Rhizoctonia solani AG-1 IB]|uniref:Uncharacterized protein n=1 Tax=Thanatephorus cucumeris (strain AG1-IB / isolate 7/3/14) TaxID=1108050 RepID=A0A0B7FNE2_THACB|nr:hypothetical protein RSOLAG1IB_03419 [Rhizoctonia solani AG-1 IB]